MTNIRLFPILMTPLMVLIGSIGVTDALRNTRKIIPVASMKTIVISALISLSILILWIMIRGS